MSIVFNAFNLVIFVMKAIYKIDKLPLTIGLSVIFYGYQIVSAAIGSIITIILFAGVYNSVRKFNMKLLTCIIFSNT